MPKIYSWTYENSEIDNAVVSTPAIPAARVLEVSRNGIGMQSSSGSTATVTTDVYEYNRLSEGSAGAVTGKYIIPLSIVSTLDYREYTYEFGPVVTPNDVYRFQYNFILGVNYTVQLGDFTVNVRDGMKAAIEGSTWPSPVTCTSPLLYDNRLVVKVWSLTWSFRTSISYGELFLYQSGYYVVLDDIIYLLLTDDDFLDYPTLPAISSSYLFNSIAPAPAGVEAYIHNPEYDRVSYSASVVGSTDITGYQGQGTLEPGKYMYDQNAATITFAEPLQPGEYIKMLYK